MRKSAPKVFPHPQKIRIERKEKAVQGTMGVNEKGQKISAPIMTNHKPAKMLFYITNEIRLHGPIINLLKVHIFI